MTTNWPAPPSVKLLRVIDERYSLRQELGQGSLGTVYLAQTLKAPFKLVALKLLRPELLADPESTAEFRHEALILERLNHPNILRLVNFKQTPNMAYLATEYIDGGSLEKLLSPDSDQPPAPLPLDQVEKLFEQITSAVGYLHQERLVHRDLKPANILVDLGGRVILADFSLTTFLNSQTPNTLVKTPAWGTPFYAAPEVWEDQAGKASDIYALGVILFQLITGRTPYQGTQDELKEQHLNAPIPRLKEAAPDLAYPSELDDVIKAALAKDPADRIKTASELCRRFKTALELKPPVLANNPSGQPPEQSVWRSLHWPTQEEDAGGQTVQPFTNLSFKLVPKLWIGTVSALFKLVTILHSNKYFNQLTDSLLNNFSSTPSPTDGGSALAISINQAHQGAVRGFSWFSGGSLGFYTGSSDRKVKVWTQFGGQVKLNQTFDEPAGVTALAVSSNLVLAVALEDNTIVVPGRKLGYPFTLKGLTDTGKFTSLTWSPDARLLAAASSDGLVWVWDALGHKQFTLSRQVGVITALKWSPDGQMVAARSTDSSINLWTKEGVLKTTLTSQEGPIEALAWSPDGQTLASSASNGSIELWNLDGHKLTSFNSYPAQINELDWSSKGQLLASASADGTVRLWSKTGQAVASLTASTSELTCLAWSADDNLAAGDLAGGIHLWKPDPNWFKTQ